MPTAFLCPNGHSWDRPRPEDSSDRAGLLVCPVCGATAESILADGEDGSIPETRPPSIAEDYLSTRLSLPANADSSLRFEPPVDLLAGAGKTNERTALAEYDILGELGQGGMGVVYRALDRRRRQVVALKIMKAASPEALYRFKQEFRSRAGLTHPNLVSLYELFADGEHWFFTMELVEGIDFLEYVRSGPDRPVAAPSRQPLTRPAQFERLRVVLGQMVSAVAALHEAGKLHRDLKPGNVLVTHQGRVVVLDFGLVGELKRTNAQQSTEGQLLGTVAYMAPEQAACRALTEAADWYSLGVILYEALTGRLPFEGDVLKVLQDKQRLDPPSPCATAAGIPDDLAELCVELLRRNPDTRPSGEMIRRRLGTAAEGAVEPRTTRILETLLVGRERHLESLEKAFAALRQGKPVAVLLSGPSGTGKSTLARRFLEPLRAGSEVVVLEGQCYEQENVPYKAFDGMVDALSRFLGRLAGLEVQPFLPRDLASLLRVFPVLRRVVTATREGEAADPQELRRRGFAALRELLARLGDRRPLVLCIDDLQWGDADSAALLAELVRPPDAPVFLLVGCYRSEEAASPFLQSLAELRSQTADAIHWHELAVEPLTPAEAQALAVVLLGPAGSSAAEAVARESGGNPLFVHELAQAAQAGTRCETGGVSLERVLWDRICCLPKAAQDLLAVLATAGRPLHQAEACGAAGLGADVLPTLALLRSQRLLRGRGLGSEGVLAVYHDRVRETVTRSLSPAVSRAVHCRLAETLEALGSADPEELAVHIEKGGEPERAVPYYARAGDCAVEALAFDRAVNLYRLSLRLHPINKDESQSLRRKLADALANTGRGVEAAQEYLAAAASATRVKSLELQRRAGLQLLLSGHIDEGVRILRPVLNAAGMRLASSPLRALLSLVFRRIRLWFRGVGFHERAASEVPAADLERIDICWSVTIGLCLIDNIRGAPFQTGGLLLALKAGEPFRIARALALEAPYISLGGGWRAKRRAMKLQTTAVELARRLNHPYLLAITEFTAGSIAYLEGSWKNGLASFARAEQLFRDHCVGVTWELDATTTFSLWSLNFMGEIAELSRRWHELMKEARERGDLFALTNLCTFSMGLIRLAADDPENARRDVRDAIGQWSQVGYHVQHQNALMALVPIELYAGNPSAALQHVTKNWPAFSSSFLDRVQCLRVTMYQMSAYSALAAAVTASDPQSLLRMAERDARQLQRERTSWPDAFKRFIHAAVAARRGETSRACTLLTEAVSAFEANDMRLFAAASRRRLGQLSGGIEGQVLVAQADAWMASQNIRNPARMTAAYAPGFPDLSL